MTRLDHRLTHCALKLFDELSNTSRYKTYSIGEFYVDRQKICDPNYVNVTLRVDVDNCLHLELALAQALSFYGLSSSHYFLTCPDRYYDIWKSDVPLQVSQLGHEVGLHTDHLYGQLTSGNDGLEQLKQDITRLSSLIHKPIRGMVYHGHPAINEFGTTNWELTKDLHSSELSLEYHDGFKSVYIKPGASSWMPDCDYRISDYLGFSNSWGWNYYPSYPLNVLKSIPVGKHLHIAFHTKNVFKYWIDWDNSMGEAPRDRESNLSFLRKSLVIRTKYGLLRGQGPKLRKLLPFLSN